MTSGSRQKGRLHSFIKQGLLASALFFATASAQAQPRLYSWGSNIYYQLGNGTPNARRTPGSVKAPVGSSALGNVRSIAVGDYFTVAARADGSVYAWGQNASGQLGNNTTDPSAKPVQVTGLNGVGFLDNVIFVATGTNFAVACKADGTVWGWGHNSYGMLGDGTYTGRRTPSQMRGPEGNGFMTEAVKIDVGSGHTMVLRSDGTLWGTGYNGYGEIGNGTTSYRNNPGQVKGENGVGFLTNVASVAAGQYFTLAVTTDGSVWSWGNNAYGQLGNNTNNHRSTPGRVLGANGVGFLTGVIAVSAGTHHGMALKSDGTVWMWGQNDSGNLGDGTTTPRLTPVQVKGLNGEGFLTGISAIAAGPYQALARHQDGSVYAWGSNSYGKLGDGTATTRTTPVLVRGPGNIGAFSEATAVATGLYHSFAIRADGTAWGWGYNANGQLGNDTTTGSNTPTRTVAPEGLDVFPDAKAVVARGYHTAVLKTDGTVYAFGYNFYGQIGDGTTVDRSVAVQVVGPGGNGALTDVIAVAAGTYFTLALKADGSVWAWGQNSSGQLGDGTTTQRITPVQVKGPGGVGVLTDIVAIAAGDNHALALHRNGSVYGWGKNSSGQLGDETTLTRMAPVQMLGVTGTTPLRNIAAIAAGSNFSLALAANGGIFSCGQNDRGQLGNGATVNRSRPVRVLGEGGVGLLNSIVAVAAGENHAVALYFDGRVYAWGGNTSGELGDNSALDSVLPIPVRGPGGNGYLTDVATIAVGFNHNLALKFDGTVWAWGYNGWGQLGDNTTVNRLSPIQVLGPDGEGFLNNILTIAAADTHSVVINGEGTIQGNIILQNASCLNAPITFQFRPVDGAPFTRTVLAGPMGLFSFTNIPPGEYDVAIKGAKWLQRTIHINTNANNVLNLRVFLLGGDANNDNSVDVLDLDLLIQAFDSMRDTDPDTEGDQSSPHWNEAADFNCDDSVDVLDLDLLVQNFDLLGDA